MCSRSVLVPLHICFCTSCLVLVEPVFFPQGKEVEQLEKLRVAYSADPSLGDVDDVSDVSTAAHKEDLHF